MHLFSKNVHKVPSKATGFTLNWSRLCSVYGAISIGPDKNWRSLGKYAPFFELGINIFNWVSQYITVLFHCIFQNFKLGILVS